MQRGDKANKLSVNYKYITITLVIIVAVGVSFLFIGQNFTTYPKRVQTGQISLAIANSTYSTVLNTTNYKIYEIILPRNSSKGYVFTTITYNLHSSSPIYASLLSQAQFNTFNSSAEAYFTKLNENSIYTDNGTYNSNAVIENTSANTASLFLIIYSKNQTSNATFSYSIDTLRFASKPTTLSYPSGGLGTLTANDKIMGELPFEVQNSTILYIYGLSNQTINYSLFDNTTNKTVFSSQPVTELYNSTEAANLSGNNYYQLNLQKGVYSIIVNNIHNTKTAYDLWYFSKPYIINPYHYNTSHSIGLAAYGITNDSGVLSTYNVNTTLLMGFLNLSALYAYSSSQSQSSHYMSAQLNGILVVTNKNGVIDTYEVQNVAELVSTDRTYYLSDNVWNLSSVRSQLTNNSISGQGYVSNSSSGYYYGAETSSYYYNYPFAFALESEAIITLNKGVNLTECYQLLPHTTNLSAVYTGYCYDNIFINDSDIKSAEFIISGNKYPPNIPFYDAEFVLGGGFNSSSSTIQSLNGELGLYYWDNLSTSYKQFPSYYSFSGDTAESASGISSTYNGLYSALNTGTHNLNYLGDSNKFPPLININQVNFTAQVNFTSYNEVKNYSDGTLNGFSVSAGNYYDYSILNPAIFSGYTCTLDGIKSLTPEVYIIGGNITLPYTFPTSGAEVSWYFDTFTTPFYNYTGNLQVLEDWTCN